MKKFDNAAYGAFRNLSGLKASPDGRHVLYTVQRMDPDKNRYERDLWVICLETGSELRLTAGGRTGSGEWLDENRVLFPGMREDSPPENQTIYYVIDIRGGEAQEYMRVPIAGAQATSLGNGRFLVRAETDVNPAGEGQAKEWLFYDEYPYLDNGGYVNKKRRSLFLFEQATGELKQLTAPLMQTYMPYFSDDVVLLDDGFCFTGYPYDRDAGGYSNLYKYIWETGETVLLCEDRCVVFSMTGHASRIWYGAWAIEDGPGLAYVRVKSVSESGGDLRVELEPDWEPITVRRSADRVLITYVQKAYAHLALWDRDGSFTLIKTPGLNPTNAVFAGEKIVFTAWTEGRLPGIYLWEDGAIRQLSHQNDAFYETYSLSVPEALTAVSDGWEICGWVMKPVGWEPGKKYPAILNIHGGPHGNVNPSFHSENQCWANAGYYVMICNPRGSTSYGKAFQDIGGDMGGKDFDDLMAFVDAALAAHPGMDADRLAVTGQSYGGIMSNVVIGKTDRFKAAVPRMSVSNWFSMHGTAVERWYGDFVVRGTPWKDPETAWKQSALRYVDQVKTPTLLIQHEKDASCPMEQAQQMYVALLERGVTVKLMVNLGCGHGGKSVAQTVHDVEVITAWFDKYVK